jgi:23S rRNA pseudouridine2605 synthase
MSERLHKLLAQHGLGSRREIEKWMLEGRILINSRRAYESRLPRKC